MVEEGFKLLVEVSRVLILFCECSSKIIFCNVEGFSTYNCPDVYLLYEKEDMLRFVQDVEGSERNGTGDVPVVLRNWAHGLKDYY